MCVTVCVHVGAGCVEVSCGEGRWDNALMGAAEAVVGSSADKRRPQPKRKAETQPLKLKRKTEVRLPCASM